MSDKIFSYLNVSVLYDSSISEAIAFNEMFHHHQLSPKANVYKFLKNT